MLYVSSLEELKSNLLGINTLQLTCWSSTNSLHTVKDRQSLQNTLKASLSLFGIYINTNIMENSMLLLLLSHLNRV